MQQQFVSRFDMIGSDTRLANDQAVENFLNGKRNLAAYQFSELVRSFVKSNNPIHNETADTTAFNYAIVNLFTGCPQRALVIFKDLVKRYPKNPRLWLRLAESMLASELAKLDKFEHIEQPSTGDMCKLLLKTNNTPIFIKVNPNYTQQFMQQHNQHLSNSATPANLLSTVLAQLKQASNLINEYDISSFNEDTHTQLSSSKLSFASPYESISRSDICNLKIKVHLNMSYVHLCMNNPTQALEHSTICLNLLPSGHDKVLANLYHAEACVLLGRVEEAIQFLNIEILNSANSLSENHPVLNNSNSNKAIMSMARQSRRVVFGDDLKQQLESKAPATVLRYNLSVAYATKGNIKKATELLMKFVDPNKPNQMKILIFLLYLQLQQGQVESAKKTILNNLPQFR